MAGLVAVTGATGFVGQHLVGALARHGFKLRLLVRRWKPVPSLHGVEAEIVLGDLAEDRALRELVAGVDAVVHAGGLIKARDPADFHKVNVEATARLAERAGGALFLLLSSLAAREPHLSPYAASKRAAEEALAARGGKWLAVRAPAVYGPGDRETLAYFKAAAGGIAPEPASKAARLSLIHVADLCEALALAVERPPPPGVCEIDDGHRDGDLAGYGYGDMAAAAAQALGRRPLRLKVPRPVMAALAAFNRVRGGNQILTAGKVAELFHADWTIHDRRLAETTGFIPRFDLKSGFADTVAWYRRHKWLR